MKTNHTVEEITQNTNKGESKMSYDDVAGILGILMGVLILFVIYLLPTIIAGKRKHQNANAIAVLNILLGWTLLGWAAALIWSSTQTTGKK